MATPKKPVKIEPAEEIVEDAPAEEPKKYADGDNSIDARMWRLNQDHIRMGSRPA